MARSWREECGAMSGDEAPCRVDGTADEDDVLMDAKLLAMVLLQVRCPACLAASVISMGMAGSASVAQSCRHHAAGWMWLVPTDSERPFEHYSSA